MRSFQAADNLYSYFTKPFQLLFGMTTSLSTLSTFTIFSKNKRSFSINSFLCKKTKKSIAKATRPTKSRHSTSAYYASSNSSNSRTSSTNSRNGQAFRYQKGNNSGFNRRSVRSDSVRSYTTSTPNRQSAPNLMTVLPLPNNQDLELTSSPSKGNELTAEIDLSDDLGVSPIHDSHEDTPMFTPRTNSRIVRIISKQSNV